VGSPDSGPIVEELEVSFQPAVVLPNVLQALWDLRHLFDDQSLDSLRSLLQDPLSREIRRRGEEWIREVERSPLTQWIIPGKESLVGRLWKETRDTFQHLRESLIEGQLEPGEVHLSSVRGLPRWNAPAGRWELELSFSGQVRIMDRATWPFRNVTLPAAILPVPHASLPAILGGTPLASGHLHAERVQTMGILRFLWNLLDRGEGSLEGEGDLPRCSVATTMVDGTRLVGQATTPESFRIQVQGSLSRSRDLLSFRVPTLVLSFPEGAVRLRTEGSFALDFGAPDAVSRPRILRAEVLLVARPGFRIPFLDIEARSWHPSLKGQTTLQVRLEHLRAQGGMLFSHGPEGSEIRFPGGGFSLSGRVSMPLRDLREGEDQGWFLELDEGVIEASLKTGRPRQGIQGRIRLEGRLRQAIQAQVPAIPEMDLSVPLLRVQVDSRVDLDSRVRFGLPGVSGGPAHYEPSGGLALTIQEARADLSGRRFTLEPGARIDLGWREGDVSSRGIEGLAMDLRWELPPDPFTLTSSRHGPSRFTLPGLEQGSLLIRFGPGGRLDLRFPEGFGPFSHWQEVLRSGSLPEDPFRFGEILRTLEEVLAHFEPGLGARIASLRRATSSLRTHLEEEGIRSPGDLIPRPVLCRMLSRLLTGTPRWGASLEPLVRDVTEGRGLDLRAAKAWIRDALPDLEADYEVDGVLRWLDLITRPGPPQPPPDARQLPPIDQDDRWAASLEDVPDAGTLYRIARDPASSPEDRQRLLDVATLLTLAQLDWILPRVRDRWPEESVHRLAWVRAAKRSIARVVAAPGPLESPGRAATIAAFLGEVLGPLPILECSPDWPPPCALGPMDVADLLQIGLADPFGSAATQWNNRLLLELIRIRDPDFLVAVLFECSQQAPHILAGVLMAMLNLPQTALRDPIDVPGLVEAKLGLPVPRREDFLAGGSRVRESYFGALMDLASEVLDRSGLWQARRARLREVHHPPIPAARPLQGTEASLEQEAQRACEAADAAAAALSLDGKDSRAAIRSVRDSYLMACETCGAFLQAVPDAFQVPWLKRVWQRHEEALRVWSVVDNVREDVDQVRQWLARTLGRPVPSRESDLIDAVIEALYWFPEDRAALSRDPLVRLLVAPPPGRYDLTVVSAMGVITDGKDGRELEDAWRRIEARRGIRLVRADTGLFRSLEYNASAILRALHGVRGPWAWIGYSQGCANGLLAESFLRGGTPDQQEVLRRLVGRQLIYSAANGSVHGTCGAHKMRLAMEQGERFLKHYQVLYSQSLIDGFLRAVQVLLDSRHFVEVLAGAHSLTLERAVALHRDGQFATWVPTTVTRGIADLEHCPEVLEWLWWMHTHQLPGALHDSQVPFDEAVGHATRVRNHRTEEMARCEIPSAVQRAHHWSPLTAEIEMITTPRDRERAVYGSPKDRHVVPWIEALARFGRVPRVTG